MRTWAPAIVIALTNLVVVPARSDSVPTFPFVRRTLANGLTVIVEQDRRVPQVSVNIWANVGSKDDPPGRSGFAHLFEHLLIQGSEHVPEDQYFKLLEHAGATDRNATTGNDRINFFETVPAAELPLALWLESDRFGFFLPSFTRASFENQRSVVKNERRQSDGDRPYGWAFREERAALYPTGHPYHRLVLGEERDLDKATFEEAQDFFRTWFVPDNMSLSIVGDVEPDVAFALVEKYFGPIPSRPLPARASPAIEPLQPNATPRVVHMEADVPVEMVQIAWRTPRYLGAEDHALGVAADLLVEGNASRLHKRLVEGKLVDSLDGDSDDGELGGDFGIYAKLHAGVTAAQVVRAVDEEIAVLADKLTAAELTAARERRKARMLFAREKGLRRANSFNEYLHYTGDPGFLARDVAMEDAVDREAVRATVARWLSPGSRVVIDVVPAKGAPPSGRVVEVK
jgi:zinc protease